MLTENRREDRRIFCTARWLIRVTISVYHTLYSLNKVLCESFLWKFFTKEPQWASMNFSKESESDGQKVTVGQHNSIVRLGTLRTRTLRFRQLNSGGSIQTVRFSSRFSLRFRLDTQAVRDSDSLRPMQLDIQIAWDSYSSNGWTYWEIQTEPKTIDEFISDRLLMVY